jgi:hypothetical protein
LAAESLFNVATHGFSRDLLRGRIRLIRVRAASSFPPSALGTEFAAIVGPLCHAFSVPDYVHYVIDPLIQFVFANRRLDQQ